MLNFIRNMFQLILAPQSGWEDISAAQTDTRRLTFSCLIPFTAIAAVSSLFQHVYHHEESLVMLFIHGVVFFVSIFVSLFIANFSFEAYVGRFCEVEPSQKKYTTVIDYTLGLLSLIELVRNFLPVRLSLYYILPLAVALIFWQTTRYMAVRQDRDFQYCLFGTVFIIVPSILIQAFFEWLL